MNTTAAQAERPKIVGDHLAALEVNRDKIGAMLPDPANAERVMEFLRRSIIENSDLAKCTTSSVMRAASDFAASGLPLSKQFGNLIIRESKSGPATASFDLTYRGMIYVALASGYVRNI